MKKIRSVTFKYLVHNETFRVDKTHNFKGATIGDEYNTIDNFYDIEGLDVIVK